MDQEEIKQQAREYTERVTQEAKASGQAVDSFVRHNPWTAVAIAGAVSFLMGLLARRDR